MNEGERTTRDAFQRVHIKSSDDDGENLRKKKQGKTSRSTWTEFQRADKSTKGERELRKGNNKGGNGQQQLGGRSGRLSTVWAAGQLR